MATPWNLPPNSIPDSDLARKATALVAQVSPPFLYHHCMRTFLFADVLGQRDHLNYDRELLYLGTLFHDLGLTDSFDGEQRYELVGADAARAFAQEHELPEEKADLLWDAIALHTSVAIALRKRPEIALVSLGATVDIAGLRLTDIEPNLVGSILEAYPRLGFNHAIFELLVSYVQRKPGVIPLTWMAELARVHIPTMTFPGFADFIQGNPFSE
jgi:hypothetical protein